MKVPSMKLPTNGSANGCTMLPFSPELLWRLPNPFLPQPPPSPLESQLKAHLPGGLSQDPRSWNREEVNIFLRYCEREFDLDKIEMETFQMNGKALCLLTKADLSERCAGAGDVIHNILQMLIRESSFYMSMPSSPLTPRHMLTPTSPAVPMSPHPWPLLAASTNSEANYPNLSHLISQTNTFNLSPAPSIDHNGHASPPKYNNGDGLNGSITSIRQLYPPPPNAIPQLNLLSSSEPPTQGSIRPQSTSSHSDNEDTAVANPNDDTIAATDLRVSPLEDVTVPTSSEGGGDGPEIQTNGRLLWDFLQQLLNDQGQRYGAFIAWKNKETGVFKIVDPAGLAKLWGIQKNHLSMNYDKMSRALRYYYRVNILRKVQGERHCYQFLRNPSELKSIKNISMLRQQIEAESAASHKIGCIVKKEQTEEGEEDEDSIDPLVVRAVDEPTDLSLDAEEKALRIWKRNHHHLERGCTINPDREREDHEPRRENDDVYVRYGEKIQRLPNKLDVSCE